MAVCCVSIPLADVKASASYRVASIGGSRRLGLGFDAGRVFARRRPSPRSRRCFIRHDLARPISHAFLACRFGCGQFDRTRRSRQEEWQREGQGQG